MDAHEKRVKIRLIKLSEFSLISFDNWSQNEMDAMRMMELTNVAIKSVGIQSMACIYF